MCITETFFMILQKLICTAIWTHGNTSKIKMRLGSSDYRLSPPRCPAGWLIPQLILGGQSHFNEPFPFRTNYSKHLIWCSAATPLVVRSQNCIRKNMYKQLACVCRCVFFVCISSLCYLLCVLKLVSGPGGAVSVKSTGSINEERGLVSREAVCVSLELHTFLKAFEIPYFYIFPSLFAPRVNLLACVFLRFGCLSLLMTAA